MPLKDLFKLAGGTPENVRPWGRYDILDEGAGYKVKRITVSAGKRLSYQSHKRRQEFWTFVAGRARLTLDGVVSELAAGQRCHIPVGAKHRVENLGTGTMIFIEVQVGDYLGEDDIERFDDDYGRA